MNFKVEGERIMNLVNSIIEDIKEKDLFSDEAINWNDLKCYDVALSMDGFWYIFISEASSDSSKFIIYVQDELSKRGIDAVVITDW